MTTTAKPAQPQHRLWAIVMLLPVLLACLSNCHSITVEGKKPSLPTACTKPSKAASTVAVAMSPSNNYFVREQRWQAPQNGTKLEYRVYQQQIDPNAQPLLEKGSTKTNLQLMQEGKAPYAFKNGKYEQVQLHHAQQDGRGAIFELTEQTHLYHTNQIGRKAVHPYQNEQHPHFPVERTFFGNDQTAYWEYRAKQITGEK